MCCAFEGCFMFKYIKNKDESMSRKENLNSYINEYCKNKSFQIIFNLHLLPYGNGFGVQ